MALAGSVVLAGGCFWHGYPARVRTHAELLVAFARKGRDLVATGRVRPETLAELAYPLERATAFAADAHRRTATPPDSLAAFDRLLERYRAFVGRVDYARDASGADAAGALDAPLAAVEDAARDVATALAREAGGAPITAKPAG